MHMCKVTVSRMRKRYAQMVLTFRITYIHKLQSQILFTHALGLGNLQYKAACVIHVTAHNQSLYIAISFSTLARIK